MPTTYLANVTVFCHDQALRIYTLCHDQLPIPDLPPTAATNRDALNAWLAAIDEQARAWLDTTPFLQALHRRLPEG